MVSEWRPIFIFLLRQHLQVYLSRKSLVMAPEKMKQQKQDQDGGQVDGDRKKATLAGQAE